MIDFGYTPDLANTEKFAASLAPRWGGQIEALAETDTNRDALNYRALARALGPAHPWMAGGRLGTYNQSSIGSCVGNAEALCCSVEAALDIVERGEPEEVAGMFSAEACYANAREAGGRLGRGDGASGYGAARGSTTLGTLLMRPYPGVDLTTYTVARCRDWGYSGIPAALRPVAKEHPLTASWLLKTVEEAWAVIGGGHVFNMCSNLGWEGDRDADGAIARSGSWAHSMAVTSRRTTAKGRRLFLVHQSWGPKWCGGPYWDDQPTGSFWIDWDACAAAIWQGDCFAKAGFNGFTRRNMRWEEW